MKEIMLNWFVLVLEKIDLNPRVLRSVICHLTRGEIVRRSDFNMVIPLK